MDSDTANTVFFSIMAVGAVVWLWSLMKAARLGRAAGDQDRMTLESEQEYAFETGKVTIRGEPADLSKALAGAIQQLGLSMFGSLFKVTERSAERIVIEKTRPLICNQPMGLYFSEAEFSLASGSQGTTVVSYQLGYVRLLQLLRKVALGVILGVGLPGMLVVGFVVWHFVVQSDEPSVRWQVFQTLQIVHVLWPPFMIMGFYTRGRRQSKVFVENLIGSVEVSV